MVEKRTVKTSKKESLNLTGEANEIWGRGGLWRRKENKKERKNDLFDKTAQKEGKRLKRKKIVKNLECTRPVEMLLWASVWCCYGVCKLLPNNFLNTNCLFSKSFSLYFMHKNPSKQNWPKGMQDCSRLV